MRRGQESVVHYTPDILVRFRADPFDGAVRAPLLTEIKHSDDLKKNAAKYAGKFAIAEQYVIGRGWEICLIYFWIVSFTSDRSQGRGVRKGMERGSI
jgi:hypothetical protein